MRGVVSLAAALALPETIAGAGGGKPLPARDLVLFLTFCVILCTLVGQSLTLPAVVKLLKVEQPEGDQCAEAEARRRALRAALQALEGDVHSHAVESLRNMYAHRLDHLADCDKQADAPDPEFLLLEKTIKVQRQSLVEMRNKGEIPDELLRRLERELDLEESRVAG